MLFRDPVGKELYSKGIDREFNDFTIYKKYKQD